MRGPRIDERWVQRSWHWDFWEPQVSRPGSDQKKCMSSFGFLLSAFFFLSVLLWFFAPNCFADYSSKLSLVFLANVPIRIVCRLLFELKS